MEAYHLGFLTHIIAIMLVIGVLAGVSTWIGGPSKGLLAVGKHGLLPPVMQKTNKNGVQTHILIIQGCIVTILILLFVFMPSVQSVYQILSQLTSILYLTMYILMFLSGMKLRRKYKKLNRPFLVPGGKVGIYIFGIVGTLGSVLALVLSFFPPSQIEVGSTAEWYLVLAIGYIVFIGIPLLIYQLRKPSWRSKADEDEIAPFIWEDKARLAEVEGKVAPKTTTTATNATTKETTTATKADTNNTSTTNTNEKENVTSNSTDSTEQKK